MQLEPNSRILITGAAGFIGFHLAKRLIAEGHMVYGLDSLTSFADDGLKANRLDILHREGNFHHTEGDIRDIVKVRNVFRMVQPDLVVHLAGQAGVRESFHNPERTITSNVLGTMNVFDAACRTAKPKQILFASSSSVYGSNHEHDGTQGRVTPIDEPQSIYAASKCACESLAHAYVNLFDVPITALRFFTVYGPYGRPDMAISTFIQAIKADRAIVINGDGEQRRDFTFIDDTVEAIYRIAATPGMRFFDAIPIGKGRTATVRMVIYILEGLLGRAARIVTGPGFADDARITKADIRPLSGLTGFVPGITLEDGLARLVRWHDEAYGPIVLDKAEQPDNAG